MSEERNNNVDINFIYYTTYTVYTYYVAIIIYKTCTDTDLQLMQLQ